MVAFIVCGHILTTFWTYIIPQAYYHDPAIRHGIAALNALYRFISVSDGVGYMWIQRYLAVDHSFDGNIRYLFKWRCFWSFQ
jgi:hypothetical protein